MTALSIALQGIGFGALAVAVQGFAQTAAASLPAGTTRRRRVVHLPGHTVYIPAPVDPRRPRKRRQADLLFLGH